MESLEFKTVLLEISDQLSGDELDKLKYLCQEEIGKRRVEKIDSGTKLFVILTERGRLGAGDTEFLGQLLTKIRRDDLSQKLNAFVNQSSPRHQDDTENAKLDIATEVIAENLGKEWRRLGRKLGLNGVKLDSIAKCHPTDLYETTVELLKEWRKVQGPAACADNLIIALRACHLNLTADIVVRKIQITHTGQI